MNLKQFTKEVNRLAHKEVEEINKKSKENGMIFGAEHYDFCEFMLKIYFEQGFTPKETLSAINDEHEQEAKWEAMVS